MTKKGRRPDSGKFGKPALQEPEEYDFDADQPVTARRNRAEKRAKFVKPARSTGSNFNPVYVLVPAILIIIVGAVLFMQNQSAANATAGGGASAAGTIREVPIQMAVADGKISISADDVRQNKLVTFDYKVGNVSVPLTAWVTPSGVIKTAVRVCEPCNGHSFRIEGNAIVCNVCGTRWNLETLKGISGGCQSYPPDVLPSVASGDTITIDEGLVKNWKPRA